MTRYRCILADPPWNESGAGKSTRGAQSHYSLMKTPDIIKLMQSWLWGDLIDRDEKVERDGAHLFLWATDNFLLDGLEVMKALGFRYVATWQWVKMRAGPSSMSFDRREANSLLTARDSLQLGLGQYSRKCHEHLLFGVHGAAMVPEPEDRPPSVIFAERGRHSEKPVEAYEMIERVSVGPRLECFARGPARAGWSTLGNEAT